MLRLMHKRGRLCYDARGWLLCLIVVSLFGIPALARAADKPPNFVFILTDDLGYVLAPMA